MSESGNYSSSGYDIPSNLPSEVEQDSQPVAETQRAHGNFHSRLHTHISDNYSQRHPLVTGHSTFHGPHISIFRKNNNDIVPEISSIYDGYKSEVKRLETFHDWPSSAPVTKEDLARNGFIYMHVNDRAQCVFCRGVLSSWEVGDIVENEHKRHCPECPFAFGYECGNEPIHSVITVHRHNANSSPSQQLYQPVSQSQTIAKVPVSQIPQPRGEVNQHNDTQNRADSRSGPSSSLPPVPAGQSVIPQTTNEPKYRDWGDEYKRVRSFKGWPTQMYQAPTELAKAGLLYMGTGDRCKCFWCGGELYDWEPQDIPWEEHAKWFSHCGYVRAMKGDAFIQNVRDRQNGLIVPAPVHERMRSPHVLSVLAEGYTQEQVEEVFNRFGTERLVDARSIKQAIEQTKRDRQAMLEASRTAGTQETGAPVTLIDDDEEMEVEEHSESTQKNKEETKTENKTRESKGSPSKTPATTSAATSRSDKDVETVLQENEKLKDMKLCKICMDNELCMTFMPCGHLATCEECAKSVQECPICRKRINQKVKIFWS